MDIPFTDNPFGRTAWKLAIKKLLGLGFRDVIFGGNQDEIGPPPGYPTWDAYFNERGLVMTDFLPLGDPAEGDKMSAVWTRDGEDVATIGLHAVHANPDLEGDTLAFTDAERAALEALFDTCWASIKALFPPTIQLERYEHHKFGVGIRRPNPKVRETLIGPAVAGTGTDDELPPQSAISVTLKTSHRKTWGRVYLPNIVVGQVDTGRISEAAVTSIRDAFGTLLDDAAAAHTPLVVWSPRNSGAALQFFKGGTTAHPESAHALGLDIPDTTSFAKSVDQVQVDDLFDVIRSRRFDRASIKLTHTLGA